MNILSAVMGSGDVHNNWSVQSNLCPLGPEPIPKNLNNFKYLILIGIYLLICCSLFHAALIYITLQQGWILMSDWPDSVLYIFIPVWLKSDRLMLISDGTDSRSWV